MENSRILIVDDTPKNLQLLGTLLRHGPYDLSFAENGMEALEVVANAPVDLIILDIMMPGMDGFEVLAHLKDNPDWQEIPVILLSARNDSDSMVQGLRAGAVDYVTKPFIAEELLARLNNHLQLMYARKNLEIAQEELNQKHQALQKANATKDKLFSIIAHDLRGPIGALSTTFEFVLKEDINLATEKELLEELGKSARSSYDLLENLLAWSRNQRGIMEFEPHEISLNPIVDEVVSLLTATAQNKGIALTKKIPDEVKVYADVNMANTIIRNLVSNALKFTPSGGRVQVEVTVQDNRAKVCVVDSGQGISEENMHKILADDEHFTTFGTNNEKGSGLGLMLCRDFAQKHGGDLNIESELGVGSRFCFDLELR